MENCENCKYNADGNCIVSGRTTEATRSLLQGKPCASKNAKTKGELPRIIGLCGYARTGKDTAAEALAEIGYSKMAFAYNLKREVEKMISQFYPDIDLNDEEQKCEYREMLVAWGKLRRKKASDYWVNRLWERWITQGRQRIAISDVRYPNEAKWIKDNGGIIIFIHRPGFVGANNEEQTTIEQIMKADLIDFILTNNTTVEDFQNKVVDLIRLISM